MDNEARRASHGRTSQVDALAVAVVLMVDNAARPYGDFRDWSAAEVWGRSVARALAQEPQAVQLAERRYPR